MNSNFDRLYAEMNSKFDWIQAQMDRRFDDIDAELRCFHVQDGRHDACLTLLEKPKGKIEAANRLLGCSCCGDNPACYASLRVS